MALLKKQHLMTILRTRSDAEALGMMPTCFFSGMSCMTRSSALSTGAVQMVCRKSAGTATCTCKTITTGLLAPAMNNQDAQRLREISSSCNSCSSPVAPPISTACMSAAARGRQTCDTTHTSTHASTLSPASPPTVSAPQVTASACHQPPADFMQNDLTPFITNHCSDSTTFLQDAVALLVGDLDRDTTTPHDLPGDCHPPSNPCAHAATLSLATRVAGVIRLQAGSAAPSPSHTQNLSCT